MEDEKIKYLVEFGNKSKKEFEATDKKAVMRLAYAYAKKEKTIVLYFNLIS